MNIADNFENWKNAKFQGLDKDQLIECGKLLDLTFPRQMSEATMRTKLCERLGEMPAPEPEAAPVVPFRANGKFDPKPHLGIGRRWEGKRYHVLVHPPGKETEHSQRNFTLTWEGEKKVWSYGITLSMPVPFLEVLKSSIVTQMNERKVMENGEIVSIEYDEVKSPRYNFNIMGVVPGTEDLPESLCQYWQWQAKKHKNFKDVNRRKLIEIRSDLYGPVGVNFYKDRTDEDILHDIHEFLGTEDFAEAA